MPDSSFLVPLLLQGAVVPFVAAGVVLLALRRAVGVPAASALAVALAFVAAYAAVVQGAWPWPPQGAMDWQPWVVLAAAAGALAIERAVGGAGRVVARAVLGVLLGLVIVWPAVGSLGVARAGAAALVAGVLMAGAWSVRTLFADTSGMQSLRLAVIAGGAGLAMMLDSSQTAGRLAGALAVSLAACVAAGRLRTPPGPAVAGTAVLTLGTLLLQAHLYAGFPLGYIALLCAAAVADAAVTAIATRRGGAASWGANASSAVLTVAPLMVVMALVIKGMQDSGGY